MTIEVLRPNAPGDFVDFNWVGDFPNWKCVDDVTPDEESTYVYHESTDKKYEAYSLEETAIPAGSTINSVRVYFRYRRLGGDSQWVKIQPGLVFAGGPYWGEMGTEKTKADPAWETDSEIIGRPEGGVWAISDLADLQIVIALDVQNISYPVQCTQVYVEVDYTPVAAYHHGLKVQGVGELALCDVGSHSLRTRKGGMTYGIELVATDDLNASAIRIKTPSGIKAIRKYS